MSSVLMSSTRRLGVAVVVVTGEHDLATATPLGDAISDRDPGRRRRRGRPRPRRVHRFGGAAGADRRPAAGRGDAGTGFAIAITDSTGHAVRTAAGADRARSQADARSGASRGRRSALAAVGRSRQPVSSRPIDVFAAGGWGMFCRYAADRLVPAFGLIRRVTRSGYTERGSGRAHMDRDPVTAPANAERRELHEPNDDGLDEIDLTDAASFPASDPPAWAAAATADLTRSQDRVERSDHRGKRFVGDSTEPDPPRAATGIIAARARPGCDRTGDGSRVAAARWGGGLEIRETRDRDPGFVNNGAWLRYSPSPRRRSRPAGAQARIAWRGSARALQTARPGRVPRDRMSTRVTSMARSTPSANRSRG